MESIQLEETAVIRQDNALDVHPADAVTFDIDDQLTVEDEQVRRIGAGD